MSFSITGPLFVVLEDTTGGYVTDPAPATGWSKVGDEDVWAAEPVTFVTPPPAAGFCILDGNGMKVAPSVRFHEGPVSGRAEDLTVWPTIEFTKEYA